MSGEGGGWFKRLWRKGDRRSDWTRTVSRPASRPRVHGSAVKPAERRSPPMSRNFQIRSLRRAWRQFQEGSLSHWITTTIIALSLTIFGAFSLLLTNAETVMEQWRGDNTLVVFMKKEAGPDLLRAVRERVAREIPAGAIQEVSPQEALQRMKRMMGPEAGLLDELDENPLPHSLEFGIHAGGHREAARLAEEISHWDGVEAVDYDLRWANRLEAVVQTLRYAGHALSGMLLAAVALIISNTIKLTIIARREEIEVMRFMGATNAFIKTPFIYEGLLQGVFGSAIALGLTSFLHVGAREAVQELGRAFGVLLEFHFLPPEYLLGIMVTGIGLGLIGALLSVARFLEI